MPDCISASGGILPGNGTTASPYLVEDYADLKTIGTGGYTLDKVYSLSADIDASASTTEDSDSGFVPIGYSVIPFTGIFLGNNHVISNLYIHHANTDDVGLFGILSGSGVTISDLGVTNANITGHNAVGALVGVILSGEVSNCYSSGQVTGIKYTGGLTGGVYGIGCLLSNCYTTSMTVQGESYTGGLTGISSLSTITNCYTTSSVTVTGTLEYTGGLAGSHYALDGSITGSNSAATVSGVTAVGGLVGENNGVISNCYNTGTVTGSGQKVGGLVGDNFISDGPGKINNSYNTGNVTGTNQFTAGFAGKNTGTIKSCYNSCDSVKAGGLYSGGLVGYNYAGGTIDSSHNTAAVSSSADDAGGLAGDNYGDITNCYTNCSVSSQGSSIGGLDAIKLVSSILTVQVVYLGTII